DDALKLQGLEAAAAEANQRAAEANAKAESERLARMKLEEAIAPRTFRPDLWAESVADLKAAGPASVNIQISSTDGESMRLGLQLVRLMKQAEWNVPDGPPGALIGVLTFGVRLAREPSPTAQKAAEALAKTLQSNHIVVGPMSADEMQRAPMSGTF